MAMPFADVAFKNNPKGNQRQPAGVLIRQKEYFHDVAVITINYESSSQQKYRNGSPVAITWGYMPSDVEQFFGYVQFTKTVNEPGHPRQLKIYCIGATYPCNQRRHRTFRNLHVGTAISRIASEHHLSVKMTPSSRWHRHILQAGRSDWNLMVMLAKEIGFTLNGRQTTIHFQSRAIDSRPGKQPVFRLVPGVFNQRGGIYKIVHRGGSAPLSERSVVQVDGLDDNGNIVTSIDTGDPNDPVKAVFTKFMPEVEHRSIRSYQEGKALLSGLSGLNRFYVIADARLSGDPRVRPGMTIGLADVNEDVDGYWWVGAVDHVITPTSYTMTSVIGRETIYQKKYVPGPRSDAGKPAIFIDEPGVESLYEPMPESIYTPLDDCVPVEALKDTPFGAPVSVASNPFESAARKQMREARPRATRRRGAPPIDPDAPVLATPRLNGWQSVTTTTVTS